MSCILSVLGQLKDEVRIKANWLLLVPIVLSRGLSTVLFRRRSAYAYIDL